MTENDRITVIKERLTTALAPIHLEIVDESHKHDGHQQTNKGGHFLVTIVSAQFAGLNLLQRQRLVYAALGDLMTTTIHALSMKTVTPDEFSNR